MQHFQPIVNYPVGALPDVAAERQRCESRSRNSAYQTRPGRCGQATCHTEFAVAQEGLMGLDILNSGVLLGVYDIHHGEPVHQQWLWH